MEPFVIDAIQIICRLNLIGCVVVAAMSQAGYIWLYGRVAVKSVGINGGMAPMQEIIQAADVLYLSHQGSWQLWVGSIREENLPTWSFIIVDGHVKGLFGQPNSATEGNQHAMCIGVRDGKTICAQVVKDGVMGCHTWRKGSLNL